MQTIRTEIPRDIIREKLLIAIKEYKITLNTLNKVTGIDINWLSDYINGKKKRDDLPIEKSGFLWELTVFLSEGIKMISEDERIKGVIDILVQIFGLEYETISLYSGLEKQDIENFMKDTNSIDYEKKYKLATASMMLHYLFKNPNNSIKNN
ncbi:HTH domain-containing protein [Desulfitobacterium sp.]|uniref:HTH domain-containing protein n=1 Tax=Desulfitobacterium sp. TaxID=49981 RepID=UPI002B7AEA51|nr:HTH domain-containing protein [Desulfitobacterium sp.]HVJ50673.1 HTH domain-containing protein [Desulfitobacterium sp.]